MVNLGLVQELDSIYSNDQKFKTIAEHFLKERKTIEITKCEELLQTFYLVMKRNPNVYFRKSSSLPVNQLQLEHILAIQNYIEIQTEDKIDKRLLLESLKEFSDFLTKNYDAKIYYTPPIRRKNLPKNERRFPISVKFHQYMTRKNYAQTSCNNYGICVDSFLKVIKYTDDLLFKKQFWKAGFLLFEEKIEKRILNEEITPGSGYEYLKAVKLFSKFLRDETILSDTYTVPQRLICNGKRTNEYAKNEDILMVIEKLLEDSSHTLRDLSILMILIETGCRPLEIVNLNTDDIYVIEKLIVLKSVKSAQRTLKLSDTVINILKAYLLIRKNYIKSKNVNSLFLSSTGNRLNSSLISQLIREYNMKAFNEIRFTPKTLRHKFITDALSEGNSMQQVQEVVGHKHLISTLYYVYRDINKFKNLFKGKSIIKEDFV